VQRPDEVGGEHEAALQHRDDEQVLQPGVGNRPCKLVEARGYGLGREDDFKLGTASPRRIAHRCYPHRIGLVSGKDSRTLHPRGNTAITFLSANAQPSAHEPATFVPD